MWNFVWNGFLDGIFNWWWFGLFLSMVGTEFNFAASLLGATIVYWIGYGVVSISTWIYHSLSSTGSLGHLFSQLHPLEGFHMDAFVLGFFSSIFFWPVLLILLIGTLAYEKEGWATFVVVVLGAVWLIAAPTIDWGRLAWGVLGYLVVGFLFTFIKWVIYSRKAGRSFRQYLKELPEVNRVRLGQSWSLKDPKQLIYVEWSEEKNRWETSHHPGRFATYLASWTVYWPMYLVLVVLEDLVKEAAHFVVENCGIFYRMISNKAFNLS